MAMSCGYCLRCGLLGGIDQVIELVTNVQFAE